MHFLGEAYIFDFTVDMLLIYNLLFNEYCYDGTAQVLDDLLIQSTSFLHVFEFDVKQFLCHTNSKTVTWSQIFHAVTTLYYYNWKLLSFTECAHSLLVFVCPVGTRRLIKDKNKNGGNFNSHNYMYDLDKLYYVKDNYKL